MATLSPLARVKADFGGKDKLVDKIVGLLGSDDEPKDDMRRRLLGAANKKLIRLHTVATELKAAGGKDAAAAAAATEMGRGKDKDYVAKLGTYSSARVLDMLTVAKRRKSRAAATPAAKAAAPKAKRAAAAPKKKTAKP
jgi:hypothetical protein